MIGCARMWKGENQGTKAVEGANGTWGKGDMKGLARARTPQDDVERKSQKKGKRDRFGEGSTRNQMGHRRNLKGF